MPRKDFYPRLQAPGRVHAPLALRGIAARFEVSFLSLLALCQIEDQRKAVASFLEQRAAHKHRNAAAVFPKMLPLEGLNDAG